MHFRAWLRAGNLGVDSASLDARSPPPPPQLSRHGAKHRRARGVGGVARDQHRQRRTRPDVRRARAEHRRSLPALPVPRRRGAHRQTVQGKGRYELGRSPAPEREQPQSAPFDGVERAPPVAEFKVMRDRGRAEPPRDAERATACPGFGDDVFRPPRLGLNVVRQRVLALRGRAIDQDGRRHQPAPASSSTQRASLRALPRRPMGALNIQLSI